MNINPSEIPDGIDYQLVTTAIAGDTRFSELDKFEKTGWRRVPVSRHPKIRSSDPKWLEQGGLALVERPKYLTQRAQEFERAKADAQVIAALGGIAKAMGDDGEMVAIRVNGRPLNPDAPKIAAKRRKNVKEFFVFHAWRLRVWLRNFPWWRS